jgi:hypothetical protein
LKRSLEKKRVRETQKKEKVREKKREREKRLKQMIEIQNDGEIIEQSGKV